MSDLGKWLIIAGIVLIVIGLAVSTDWLPLGRLPGDIVWRRGNVTVFLPLGTMVLLSVLLSIIMAIIGRR
ncbi:MAG: DUF2905 domain-containing protein [Firmicutes bacterium]|nr:DUF2905 domain-containing protein [Bacillota bacterium]HOB34829.1 DUF2905 domain-containing protein [Bacillota bacterium]HPZ90765.1 DUF2905 domain-containing protein [Bacillota bacterium]HQE01719.1 DUF2905 domain-containing protein [Bacillota bacterium]